MRVANPESGTWHETDSTTATAIADEMGLFKRNKWSFKINGEVRKTLPSNLDKDSVIEMVDDVDDSESTMSTDEHSGDA